MRVLKALHLIFALACAVAMSQFPAYYDQYTQRLGGALDEVSARIAGLDARAAAAGLDRYDYIRRFEANDDEVVRGEAVAMIDTLARHKRLRDAYSRLRAAPWYATTVELAFHLEPDIARNALRDFAPALPLSVSGGAHAFLGFFFGYLIPAGLRSLLPKRSVREA